MNVTLPTADPAVPIEQLMHRAMQVGNKRAKLLACDIRRQVDLLQRLLVISDEENTAREAVEQARARLAQAKAKLAATTSSRPEANADSRAMRAWLVENEYPVADRGRLRPEFIDAYLAAHPGGRA